MQLAHIELKDLKISKTNMRYRDPAPDVSDILPSIRQKGVLMPLLVRPEDGKYGVVAGRRRWFSLKSVKEEVGEVAAPPCAIMEEGDDADAIEASLLENVARRDADPMREYETFVRLITQGRTVDHIAATFGMTTTQVKQRLALGNLLPNIRDAYRVGEIDDETVRHLTLASPAQQRKWLRLFNDPEQYAPRGAQLKQWLFGGQEIPTGHALFKLADYSGQIIEDLFGEVSYFADADLFWALQNRAIAAKRDAHIKAGWSAVEILEIGQRFQPWDHVKVPKKKGGKVFISVSHDGEVTTFDGLLTQKEAKRLAKAKDAGESNAQKAAVTHPAITKGMQNYLDLHRHAVVRLTLLAKPETAWRLAVAHMAVPTGHWRVSADPQRANSKAIGDSIARSPAQAAFEAEQQAVYVLLGWSDDACSSLADVFANLLALSDAEVQRVAAFFMAASLEAGGDVVEDMGAHFKVDAHLAWQPDDCFLDLVRDRATLNAMLAEVAGPEIAAANVAEKAKTQRQIVQNCLSGSGGRQKVEGWLPGWMAFPSHPIGQGLSPMTEATGDEADVEPDRIAVE